MGYERRFDVAASIRRACAARGRRSVAKVLSAPLFFAGFTAATAGLEWTGTFLFVSGLIVLQSAPSRLPDVLFEEPGPKKFRSKTLTPGMSDGEVSRRLAIHSERHDLQAEKIEKERRKQRRKAKTRQG